LRADSLLAGAGSVAAAPPSLSVGRFYGDRRDGTVAAMFACRMQSFLMARIADLRSYSTSRWRGAAYGLRSTTYRRRV